MSRPTYGLLLRSNFRKIRMCITYGVSKANFFTNVWIGKWDFFHNIWQQKSILGRKNTLEKYPLLRFFRGSIFQQKIRNNVASLYADHLTIFHNSTKLPFNGGAYYHRPPAANNPLFLSFSTTGQKSRRRATLFLTLRESVHEKK